MLLLSSLFLPMFCYLPFILHYFIFVYVIYFHLPFMRVTSMSFHYLFISFHCPSMPCRKSHRPFLLFFHVLLIFLWFPFPFVSFSFWSSFHVPFILLSCHFSFLPFFLQVIPFFLYVLSFEKIISNFRAYSFQIMFMVLASFHDFPCPFKLLFSSLLLITFYLYVDDRHNKCAG